MSEGGTLIISVIPEDEEDKKLPHYRLNLASIKKGLQVMADKFPKHFADVTNDNADATTGDVFLQCALFGDVIYG